SGLLLHSVFACQELSHSFLCHFQQTVRCQASQSRASLPHDSRPACPTRITMNTSRRIVKHSRGQGTVVAAIALALFLPCFASSGDVTTSDLPSSVETVLHSTCVDCHNPDIAEGGLNFEALSFDLSEAATRDRWIRVHDRVK